MDEAKRKGRRKGRGSGDGWEDWVTDWPLVGREKGQAAMQPVFTDM